MNPDDEPRFMYCCERILSHSFTGVHITEENYADVNMKSEGAYGKLKRGKGKVENS